MVGLINLSTVTPTKNQNHLHDLLKYEKLVFHQTF